MWFHYPMNWGFSFSALPGKGNTSGAGPYILAAGTACRGNAMSQGHGWSMEKHHEMQQYFRLVNIYIYLHNTDSITYDNDTTHNMQK